MPSFSLNIFSLISTIQKHSMGPGAASSSEVDVQHPLIAAGDGDVCFQPSEKYILKPRAYQRSPDFLYSLLP